jgi:phospholipid/cholesterol/gamma-HCH transport system substrate-binding protein
MIKTLLIFTVFFGNSVFAEDPKPKTPAAEREIPMDESSKDISQLVNKMNTLVGELNEISSGVKEALNPADLKAVMSKLNQTLENAAATLSPKGALSTTAQRALAKLEDAIEQIRQMMTRINQGQGSVGRMINDPVYADEVRDALKSINKLLGRVNLFRFVVDIGGERIAGYEDSRASFKMAIWPVPT